LNASEPFGGMRVLCLYEGTQPQTSLPALLAADDTLQFLGSFDIAPGPLRQLRNLDPNVVILQLPMHSLQVLRWISYVRTRLRDSTIIVTGPVDEPYYRLSVMSYGADEFIPEEQIASRLMRRISALSQKYNPPPGPTPNTRPAA
jgi:DNA-binding NarL/FixJ family response regulator